MKFARNVEFSPYYLKLITNGIERFLKHEMFNEIFTILKSQNVINSNEILENAIRNNKIYYENGYFKSVTGKFTNAISKELEKLGATYTTLGYKLDSQLIPVRLLQALDIAKAQNLIKLATIYKYLNNLVIDEKLLNQYIQKAVEMGFANLQKNLEESIKDKRVPVIELEVNKAQPTDTKELENYLNYFEERSKGSDEIRDKIDRLKQDLELVDIKELDKAIEEQWTPQDTEEQKNGIQQQLEDAKAELREYEKETQKNAPEKPKLDGNQTSVDIANDYTYNMQFWVKKWSAKEIEKMRKDVLEFQRKGIRRDEIQRYFEKEWNIAENKARFLARNESGLASTAIKLAQFKKLGVTHFKWLKSTSREKRELHKEYYGRVFAIDNPPIIDEETGQRGYPKQIYNCSCSMAPAIPESVNNDKSIIKRVINAMCQQFTHCSYKYRRLADRQKVSG